MGHFHDPRSPHLVYQSSGEFITVRYVDCDGFSCNGQYKLIGSLIGISENSVAKVVLAASTFTTTTRTPKMHMLHSLLASGLLFTPQHLEALILQSANYPYDRKPASSRSCGRSQLPRETFLIQDLHGMLSFLSMNVSLGRFSAHSPVVNGSSLFLSYRWVCPLF